MRASIGALQLPQERQWATQRTMAHSLALKLQRGCDNNVPIAGGVTCRHRQLSNSNNATAQLCKKWVQ